MTQSLDAFVEIWLLDFEFRAGAGQRQQPLCLVAREQRSGRLIRRWLDGEHPIEPPFRLDRQALFVAYYASAELGCFLALGWSLPLYVLDLYVEFRNRTNGLPTVSGSGLLGALSHFGLPAIEAAEKESMRALALRQGEYSPAEQGMLLDYCQSDVEALGRLLPHMAPGLDLPRALLRGRYMAAAAHMEWHGVPLDEDVLPRLRKHWDKIRARLIDEIDAEYGVYPPTNCRVDPATPLGAAIHETALEWELDPFFLAEVVEHVWLERRSNQSERGAALRSARQVTGLTPGRISRWENRGADHSSYPGLDSTARELASELPELGLGPGYQADANYDAIDHAARLWALLREPDRRLSKHSPEILQDAARIASSSSITAVRGPRSFSAAAFGQWLARNSIPWLHDERGRLKLDDDTFRQMARLYPDVASLRELRHALSELRLQELAMGADGRNRVLLSAFRARTGRNQPSNSGFIFGPSVWLRGLIKPAVGRALAYVDWSQQEFGIAAALSGDPAMQSAYQSSDPYLAFAKQARAVPADATKESHGAERERFKACILAVQYGMGEQSLAERLGQPPMVARELLRLHRQTYPTFWKWSQAAVDHALLHGWLQTVFGWRLQIGAEANPRSLANFPMQANGAEMLRLACCLLTEAGVEVCAPIHDALLVEASERDIDDVVLRTQATMAEASRIVLDGFELRSEAKVVRYPDRYMDPRGARSWSKMLALLCDIEHQEAAHSREVDLITDELIPAHY